MAAGRRREVGRRLRRRFLVFSSFLSSLLLGESHAVGHRCWRWGWRWRWKVTCLGQCNVLFYRRLLQSATESATSRHAARDMNKSFADFEGRPSSAGRSGAAESNSIAQKFGFKKISEEVIDECKSTAVLYEHLKIGAEIMSLTNDNENKVFGIVFQTPPKDSTGIPHILEHSVLCGSKKYPLKEPFVELLKSSLHTFLNAFTYPDRTCFLVASTNLKNFYNLVDVYLDAVFFPKCVEDFQTFQQEGWHYELNDPSEEISFKGVVLNEMKGVYLEPDNILGRVCQQVTHSQKLLLSYRTHKYYHPSNAKIWFYGDDDSNECFRILSAYLDQYDKSPVSNESRIEPQKLFLTPVRVIVKYPTLDLETELALCFLDHLLLGTPASPLRRILLESRLRDAIVGNGVEDELLQPQFSTRLKGVSEDDVQKVEELIMSTLKNLAAEGFGSEAVDLENNTGSFPRGLSLMLRSIIVAEGSKAVFCPLIEKLILNNAHCVTIEMQPDPNKESQDKAVERQILEKVKSSMTQEDLVELVCGTRELRLRQETPDPPEALKFNGVKVLQHDLFTNDVLYLEVVFDLCHLRQDLLQLIPLFCQSLLEMGTRDLDFVQLNQLVGRKTGGISIYPFTSSVREKADPCFHVIVHGKAMGERVEDLFSLIRCILQDVQFTDQQRFEQLVSQSKAGMESCLRGSGDAIAATRMDAKLNAARWISEQLGEISYLEFLRDLEKRVDKEWPAISSSLDAIRSCLLSREGCIVNMTADGKILTESSKYLAEFIDAIPSVPSPGTTTWSSLLSPMKEAIVVNYVGKAANIYEAGYQLHGNSYLWDRIQVSGGAYSTYSTLDTDSGVFSDMSSRDLNLLKTVDVYDATANFLRELELDDNTLTKAIIKAIGDVDPYQLPKAKGYSSLMRHLLGITEEERQIRHEEILSTSMKHFREFADAIEVVKDKGVVVAVASIDDVAKANEEKGGFFKVKKVL
ncbi:unnamed protein product [Spirodela intermedia]|uniref:Peptidase M16C associated domain-containing protein n=1 Tax=Spirodela intermedia TaxID=51605 RepID=A0A7I8KUX9_SPIIN|nr:unnamed protein product [Spirodela intermedia]